ncbi:D-glycero-alpha-D-manno-heptose-1,7-bisphosphate 7-phosphatase [Shouchella sp. JSM 1781072]|uniref:D-glycero-alpha-D-manno-heptose-1,7-bisphosphate 7-phosphatase n=1 Tax=Shouchella sp. JSM 1781072 TaxID=3344581 RepID=UPI0035BF7D30
MNRAVFLDRDGVINEVLTKRVKFVNKPDDFHLLKGVALAIKQLNEAGLFVFVVTNQGGVGLGFLKEEMLLRIHDKMINDLEEKEAKIDDVAYCVHKPKAGCLCRKPGTQMIRDLAQKHHIDLKRSVMVGDREPDIEAGRAAGCKTILVGERYQGDFGADAMVKSLQKAVPWILDQF